MRSLKHGILSTVLGLAILIAPAWSNPAAQQKFATPEAAAVALQQALKIGTPEEMQIFFGSEWVEIASSGDPVADQNDRQVVALAMEQSWHWEPKGKDAMELIVGDEQWPFPVPLVRTGSEWRFDSEEGIEEVLARRIGRNELGVIEVCHDYVDMQKEYAGQSHDGKPAGLFAQQLRSSEGRQDGLYWHRKPGEKRSPLGSYVADATAEGYDPNQASTPYRGYYFRILTAQGPAAPGGKKSYIVNGNMSGGFALVAYPAKYAASGVMTFVVNQEGIVYEKDLGEDTATEAPRLTEYNPDKSWKAVQEP